MSIKPKPQPGVVAVLAGVAVYVAQMFVGLNDESEYSNPWYLEVARWFATTLVLGGLAWVAGSVASTRMHGGRL